MSAYSCSDYHPDIGPEFEAALASIAGAQCLAAEQYAKRALERAFVSAGIRKPLSARIREIRAGIPDEVRAGAVFAHTFYWVGPDKSGGQIVPGGPSIRRGSFTKEAADNWLRKRAVQNHTRILSAIEQEGFCPLFKVS